MVRAYKAVCHDAVTEVESAGIISNVDSFRVIVESGHNPRKFVFLIMKIDLMRERIVPPIKMLDYFAIKVWVTRSIILLLKSTEQNNGSEVSLCLSQLHFPYFSFFLL